MKPTNMKFHGTVEGPRFVKLLKLMSKWVENEPHMVEWEFKVNIEFEAVKLRELIPELVFKIAKSTKGNPK